MPYGSFHGLKTTLRIHILDVKADNRAVIPSKVHTLELSLERERILECVLLKIEIGRRNVCSMDFDANLLRH